MYTHALHSRDVDAVIKHTSIHIRRYIYVNVCIYMQCIYIHICIYTYVNINIHARIQMHMDGWLKAH